MQQWCTFMEKLNANLIYSLVLIYLFTDKSITEPLLFCLVLHLKAFPGSLDLAFYNFKFFKSCFTFHVMKSFYIKLKKAVMKI